MHSGAAPRPTACGALNLKGLSANEHYIDLDAGDQRSEAFLQINPLGANPGFDRAGSAPLTQSLAILEYLDETVPNPRYCLAMRLAGRGCGRSRRGWRRTLTADRPRVRRYLTTVGGFDDAAWRAWQIQWFTTGLQALEKRLATEAARGGIATAMPSRSPIFCC